MRNKQLHLQWIPGCLRAVHVQPSANLWWHREGSCWGERLGAIGHMMCENTLRQISHTDGSLAQIYFRWISKTDIFLWWKQVRSCQEENETKQEQIRRWQKEKMRRRRKRFTVSMTVAQFSACGIYIWLCVSSQCAVEMYSLLQVASSIFDTKTWLSRHIRQDSENFNQLNTGFILLLFLFHYYYALWWA